MSRFVWSQLRFRRSRAAVLAVSIVVAAVGFALLTGTAKSSQLHVHGTLTSTFRPAYDILVRPRGTQTALERREGLVRPNFLSGIYGGISLAQWHRIENTQGVAVAAPIANIGFLFPFENMPVSLAGAVTRAPHQLYRVDGTWIADDGLSRYPQTESYVYDAPRDRFVEPSPTSGWLEKGPDLKHPMGTCNGFRDDQPPQATSPFPSAASGAWLACFPSEVGSYDVTVNGNQMPTSRRFVGTEISGYFPIYISAIDPVQEAKLVHLDRTILSGRYFTPNEGWLRIPGQPYRYVPVLASDRSYVREQLQLTIRRLAVPRGADLPHALAASSARRFAAHLTGLVVTTRSIPLDAFYHRLLTRRATPAAPPGVISSDGDWTTAPTRYRQLGPNRLAPLPVHNPLSIWRSQLSNWYQPPLDNLDPQFRRLHERLQSNIESTSNGVFAHPLKVIGQFDPTKLPGFSPLTRVPLETYYPPTLLSGDAAAERALKGHSLTPSQNLGGYIQPPPLLLTTMRGLRFFLDPSHWLRGRQAEGALGNGKSKTAVPKAQRLAPISAIRVKVAGVTGLNSLSLERIKVAAQKIHAETGLTVDITAGSSPHPVEIALPKGHYGRPALLLREGWSKKGVTVSFLQALDRKDLALFALVLVICGFFLGNGALAAVRARRPEIGTLLTLGWTRRAIFRTVLAELALVGIAAGILGSALAAVLVRAFSLRLPLLHVLLVLPIAVLLALAAGALPAWLAARGLPLDALRPPVTARRRARPVRRLATLALVNLTRLPGRTLVAASGLAIGVAALAVLIGIQQAFQGTLVGTLLGNAISLQVRGADFAAVALTLALAALSVADVVYLNLRERQAELVTLRTLGWTSAHLRTTVLLESFGLGVIGSLAGAVLAVVVGSLLGIPASALALGLLAAAAAGTLAALVATLVPLRQIDRLVVPAVLAVE